MASRPAASPRRFARPRAQSRQSEGSISRSPGARRWLCSGPTVPASRRRSTCCWGSATGRWAGLALRRQPAAAVGAGQIGADAPDRCADPRPLVRELVQMVASLYPAPLDVDEILGMAGIDESAGAAPRSSRVARPSGCACDVARGRSATAGAGRAHRGDGCRRAARLLGDDRGSRAAGTTVLFATHYLEEADAYADRVVLMARRVVARRPADGDQGRVGPAHDTRHGAWRRPAR